MKLPTARTELTTRRLVLVGTFLLVAGVTAALFAQAVTGHLASMHVEGADVTVVDYDVTDDGGLDLTLRIDNPTVRDVELVGGRINAYADGDQVTDGTTSSLDPITIESGETKQVTFPLGLRESGDDRLRNADPAQIEVRGALKVYVVEKMVHVPIRGLGVTE
jgi:LEA14-like dessication related protein